MRPARTASVAGPRRTKLRTFTVSGTQPAELPSRARPHKPPAKALSARKAAALGTGGGKLPPKIRGKLDEEAMPVRVHLAEPAKGAPSSTRYGKREPRGGAHDHAAEMRDAVPSRRGGNRPPDAGTRRAREARQAPRH
jgi:hypothetical protein